MSKSTKSTALSFNVVRIDGTPDRDASLKAAADAYDRHIAQRHTDQETIKDAVHAVFSKSPGANITMPAITGMISRELNCNPANYALLTGLALDYVRENAGPRESGKLFGIQKGKGKGVVRWSDVPVKADGAAAPAATVTEETESDETDSSDDDQE